MIESMDYSRITGRHGLTDRKKDAGRSFVQTHSETCFHGGVARVRAFTGPATPMQIGRNSP